MILVTVGPHPYLVFERASVTLAADRTKADRTVKEKAPLVLHFR
jgi:hypothetical protein